MNKINQIKAGDIQVEFCAIVTMVTCGKNNRSSYLTLVFQDDSGSVVAKLWNATSEQIQTITSGKVVQVVGDAILYNEELQIKISHINILSSAPEEQVKYLRNAPISKEEIHRYIQDQINKIQNQDIYIIVSSLYSKYQEDFLIYPAASKNHHEFVSGLAYHTMSMLHLGIDLCQLYPELNKDLLVAGIILHDFGKLIELSGPIVPEYTLQGKLLGHISICQVMIDEVAKEHHIEGEVVYLLKHLVLSHHGHLEYGSPILPLIREAEILHLIDNIDARMNSIDKALENLEPGEFSKRIFSLENRCFYKPKL